MAVDVASSLRRFVRCFVRSFVASSLRRFVASFVRSFVASSLRRFVASSLRSFVVSFVRGGGLALFVSLIRSIGSTHTHTHTHTTHTHTPCCLDVPPLSVCCVACAYFDSCPRTELLSHKHAGCGSYNSRYTAGTGRKHGAHTAAGK